MSLESGGRADKYGNKYENRYLAILLLRLVNEEIISVTVEPLGTSRDSAEYVAEYKDGTNRYYQCKASNGAHNAWSISDLKKYDVFKRAKEIITADCSNMYCFISPLGYNELDELCKRAKTNSSPEEFERYQLTNEKIRNTFEKCKNEFGFSKKTTHDELQELVCILSHCYFEQYIFGTESEQDLEERIGMTFAGKAASTLALLEQYVNNTGNFGIKITAKDVVDYLAEQNIHVRNYQRDEKILHRIDTFNSVHWDRYYAINETIIHRTETDRIIDHIQIDDSVILHGKAGTGKSGCLQETIDFLNRNGILYLSVKLDKYIPRVSADEFGRQLGLPESPVYCLATLAAGKKSVLILDQLDALRWTSQHSSDALSVCKELISQAEAINKHHNGKITIIFAARTFDLENDKGLKELFNTSKNETVIHWEKISVNTFSKEDAIRIVGKDYNVLSSRLKKLLLIPSSLYVWSKIEKGIRRNSISSVRELMDAWWKQIQNQCESIGLLQSDVLACKNEIVTMMERRAVFTLPEYLFPDQQKVIDAFVSNGLLNLNVDTKCISFVHQSFLDYFITSDLLHKIYSGFDLKNLIGGLNEQTPLVRYRILTVLQNLMDTDESLLLEQSKGLLESDSVRYYFKCTVFEIIGQCEQPNPSICNLIDTYFEDPQWSDLILRVVYFGHAPFIMRLDSLPNNNWISDISLQLLKSVSNQIPDFVTEKLQPFALKNADQDNKIFWALCRDMNDDSEKMFRFRLKLLQNNPVLFQQLYGLSELIKRSSPRTIDLFYVLLDFWREQKKEHFYLGQEADIDSFARENYDLITNKLFSRICEKTCNYKPKWPYFVTCTEYEDLDAGIYNKSIIRKIIEIVKLAFEEYALTNPQGLILFVKGVEYPISAVGHEIIMHGLSNLPTDYGNQVIEWLLEDFDNKIFVFSANVEDYLCYAKKILEKFSPTCDVLLFQQLEKCICNWKESTERMTSIYENRCETNKEFHGFPVYYAFWGHFQKSLLPSMSSERLSTFTKQLINVLNRNSWIHLPYFYSHLLFGPAKSVASPIDGYTERLSDATWIKIITTSPNKMNKHWNGKEKGEYYIETSHWAFACALGKEARLQPERFAKLSLSFPDDCYVGYITNVLNALSDNDLNQGIDNELMTEVIRHYCTNTNYNVSIAISRIIEKNACEIWPEDILKMISEVAIKHMHPGGTEYPITDTSDPEHNLARSLHENSMNCARGCAIYAIAALLWNHSDLGEFFKKTIIDSSSDKNDSVRFAVTSCVLPYYYLDKDFAIDVMKKLIDLDPRVLIFPGCWEIISREYDTEGTYFIEKLWEACSSEICDLSEYAARILCAITIFHHDLSVYNGLLSYSFNNQQVEQICLQAVSSFNKEDYHEQSKNILVHFIDSSTNEISSLERLFFDNRISIKRDEAFLIHLMETQQNIHLIHSILDYIYERDEDICYFSHVLATIGVNLTTMASKGKLHFVVDDLVKCVVQLFDKGEDNLEIRKICLDIWDKLFMCNFQNIKALTDMIDDFV